MKKKKLPIFLTIITCITFSVVPAYAAPTGVTQLFLSTASGPLASYSDINGDKSYNKLTLVHQVVKDNNYANPLFKKNIPIPMFGTYLREYSITLGIQVLITKLMVLLKRYRTG
ncbi:hypothetical protein [Paenibacillus ginsengarvi]|uniref:Uncharacterized protein n=1 Tax=Paenibacillus ginsengarvi TaxID=400777 RepID=A0A3B0C194_9BACL|nr:hypothetical protein [Paenibacillus ginsengarvi]RKN79132.1 hypothetical protein D7M11_20830 [Paenibacillus ginsengarvi]